MDAVDAGGYLAWPVSLLPDLPIFRWMEAGGATFYAPGCLAVTTGEAAPRLRELLLGHDAPAAAPGLASVAATLRRQAERAVAAAAEQASQTYRPLCLTLYLSQACDLACTYCYADAGPSAAPLHLTPPEIGAAAALVAANCAAAGQPLTVVFHGGGEPTTDPELLWQALDVVRQAARDHGSGLFTYIATAGCIAEHLAERLAASFDLVGLSCDGPPAVQDRQRAMRGGAPTSTMVERTARTLRRAGRPFHVRSTITAETVGRQAEIAEYVGHVLAPAEMHFEPVYSGGRQQGAGWGCSTGEAAAAFVQGYAEALAVGERQHIPLRFSAVRLGEVHGPFCQVSRQVLNLVPGTSGAAASACFKQSTAALAWSAGLAVGGVGSDGRLTLDEGRVEALHARLSCLPAGCRACFNRYHCAGECPDRCRLEPPRRLPGFRCLAQRLLAHGLLRRKADALRAGQAARLRGDGACLTTDLG